MKAPCGHRRTSCLCNGMLSDYASDLGLPLGERTAPNIPKGSRGYNKQDCWFATNIYVILSPPSHSIMMIPLSPLLPLAAGVLGGLRHALNVHRSNLTQLTSNQFAEFVPFIEFARTAYCPPNKIERCGSPGVGAGTQAGGLGPSGPRRACCSLW